MSQPLVTVICLCYNHAQVVREAIQSVIDQTYPNIQLIVVDDASTDKSVGEINKVLEGHPAEFLQMEKNMGNCAAFNRGLKLARGEFVIDLAADDVMMPHRVAKQVAKFQALAPDYGVVFSDADYVDENGRLLRHHFEYLFRKKLLNNIPEGDVYAKVISTYFIASPTMMIRRAVLDHLNGYDEELAYEDFDFWVRSARTFKYAYVNERLTRIRKSRTSMSAGWYKVGDRQLHSTYLVCRKAQQLNREKNEVEALVQRVRFELRQSVFSKNLTEAVLFYDLLGELTQRTLWDRLLIMLGRLPVPLPLARDLYHRLKYSL